MGIQTKPMLFARVEPDFAERVQEVADAQYEGNVSMLVRVAVRRFIEPVPDRTDADATLVPADTTDEAAA